MNDDTQRPAAVITGTSTGIGLDAARYLIAQGWEVLGSVRKEADGNRVRETLGERFHALIFDVTDEAAIQAAAGDVRDRLNGRPLNALINNAGIAVYGPLEHVPLADVRRQFEINVFGALAVTQAFLPLLAEPGGRIVNISSVSGQIAFPFFGPYAGSKFALEAMSDSLRRELTLRGIDVILVEPGSVDTPIWDKARENEDELAARYAGTIYRRSLEKLKKVVQKNAADGMPVERVSETIFEALTARSPRPRYALPNEWFQGWFAPRYLPTRLIDRFIVDALHLKRES